MPDPREHALSILRPICLPDAPAVAALMLRETVRVLCIGETYADAGAEFDALADALPPAVVDRKRYSHGWAEIRLRNEAIVTFHSARNSAAVLGMRADAVWLTSEPARYPERLIEHLAMMALAPNRKRWEAR